MKGKYVKKKKMAKKLLCLAMEISGHTNNGKAEVDFKFFPITLSIEIRVYLNGWESGVKPDASYTIWFDERFSYDNIMDAINYLEEIKNEAEL